MLSDLSTFISAISAAKPKIAAYPFTTLTPNLGVVLDDQEHKLIVAESIASGEKKDLGKIPRPDKNIIFFISSLIQTILSASEFHRIMPCRLAGFYRR